MKDRKLIYRNKQKNVLEKILIHFIPYFKNAEIEDLQINEFSKVTLIKRGGVKEFIADSNFTKEYLRSVMFAICGMNNQIFSELNQQITAMLPINYVRLSGCMGISIKSCIEISIRLNDDNSSAYSYKDFNLSELAFNYLVKNIAEQQASVFLIGGTGSGKTTFTNLLIQYIADNEVIKVVGDIHDYIFKSSQKYSELFAKTQVEYQDKFDLLMRINPDRIIIPELTTSNVDLILRAMNSGHKGFMLTLHSGDSEIAVAEAFKQNLALSGKEGIDVQEIQKSITSNIDFLIFLHKNQGKREISKIIINNQIAKEEACELNIFGYDNNLINKSTQKKNGNKINSNKSISKALQELQGLSQREVALKYNISRTTIRKIIKSVKKI